MVSLLSTSKSAKAKDTAVMTRLALVVEYEGSQYNGFQLQVGVPTVQGRLEEALEKVTGERIRILGASRTDTGVHAKGQVVSFKTASQLPSHTFTRAMNYYLPSDISVRATHKVPDGFNARRSALRRRYRYTILNDEASSPLLRSFVYWLAKPLDISAMSEAVRLLEGERDFASFSGPTSYPRSSTMRRIYRAELAKRINLIMLDVEANSFLPQQIRRTVGALVQIGTGKMSLRAFRELLDCCRLGAADAVLPAQGLCLMSITYPGFSSGNEACHEDLYR
ncbi:MAG: tRNA pseudouridine(38-40) synthase TruA [Dehalococcoidia bacterium]